MGDGDKMRDLAERIVTALSDFDRNGIYPTEDGREIERLFAVHRSALGCVGGVKRAKIDFVHKILVVHAVLAKKNRAD